MYTCYNFNHYKIFSIFWKGGRKWSIAFSLILCLSQMSLAQQDCCDQGGDKVKTFTFQYTGENCGSSNNSQQSDKWDCDDFNGGPAGDQSVYIISSDDENGNGDIYFSGTVNLNETFSPSASNVGENKLNSKTFHHIYSSQGGSLLQRVEVHASCSAPVVIGDQFGSLLLTNAQFENGFQCGPSSPPNNSNCTCQSGIYTVTFVYNGPSGIGGGPYDYHDNELGYWSNLVNGQSYTFDISNTNHSHWHEHNDPIFWTYQNGWIEHGTMDSSCGSDVLGNSYGPFTITGWVDLQGNQCNLNQACDNVTNGGVISGEETNCGSFDPALISSVEEASGNSNPNTNGSGNNGSGGNNGDCCNDTHGDGAGGHNHVKSLYLQYSGPTGNVNLFTNDNSGGTGTTNITQFVQSGSNVLFEAAGSQKFGADADFSYPGGSVGIHTSCSDDDVVVGNTFGPFLILGVSTANGSSCGEFGPPPPPPVEPIEYQWIQSTTGCPNSISQAIPGATGATYNPPTITQTTWYVRLSKRETCEENTIGDPEGWIASNCVIKEVTTCDPCVDQGGDSDNDGVCNNQDCQPFNPAFPATPGSPCNDGNPNTSNDVVQADGCTCQGTTNDPCANQGGDSDNDGVCNNQDCQPFNPAFPATPGSPCNDGNSNTENDVVQSDGCSCAGTPISSGCSVSVSSCNITITGLNNSDYAKVFNENWQIIWECNPWNGGACNTTEVITVSGNGNYWVQACGVTEAYAVTGCGNTDPCANQGGDSDNDGVCNNQDCQPYNSLFPATPGSPCNDGNSNTENDVVQSDGCSCAGTPISSGCSVSVSSCNITITGLNNSDYAKVFNENWQIIWDCNPWNGGGCNTTEVITVSANGNYWVQACGVTEAYAVTGCGNTDPCANQGGDSDNDGVCDNQDCQPNNPAYPATPGSSCNDGNPNTSNDIVQADGCSCAGIPTLNDCIKYRITDSSPECGPFPSETGVFYRRNCGESFEVWKAGSDLILKENGNGTAVIQGSIFNGNVTGHVTINLDDFSSTGQNWSNTCYNNLIANEYYYTSFSGTVTVGSEVFVIEQKSSGVDFVIGNGANNQSNGSLGIGAWVGGTWGSCVEMFGTLNQILPGDSCDDGNTQTTNDVYLADGCTCEGTYVNNSDPNCDNININVVNASTAIQVSGLSAPVSIVNVFDQNWNEIFNCSGDCDETEVISNLSNGTYYVKVAFFNQSWQRICDKAVYIYCGSGSNLTTEEAADNLFFSAYRTGNEVSLAWITNSEYKNESFEIEHSTDGVNFSLLKKRISENDVLNETFNYADSDARPSVGMNYYRLKKRHKDGSHQYSEIREVSFGLNLEELVVYPNPANQVCYINMREFTGMEGTLFIHNTLGQLEWDQNYAEIPHDPVQLRLNQLSNGLYTITLRLENGKSITEKLMVVKL